MTLDALTLLLKEAGVPDPKTDAALLIRHFCGVSAAALLADRQREYHSPDLDEAVAKRLARTPLQYIIGETAFFGETYRVTPAVLVPRPDTELLVEEAIARLPKGIAFGDLCAGSGCVGISILAHRPDLTATAVDISADALAIAAENAERNGVADRLGCMRFDLLAGKHPRLSRLTALVANPPYILSSVIPTLEKEVKKEPALALDGGEDGLVFYRTLLALYSPDLFLFEIGYDQAEAVSALGREKGYTPTVKKDAGGNHRVVILSR
ncbi:MAG: peptide chain release factor N(5)-glutamine methyltransferase [Clostridia bacterium]|nr:peptide chain release factor N(5)-glutamine methyltransferase [Clostridia bacterium]